MPWYTKIKTGKSELAQICSAHDNASLAKVSRWGSRSVSNISEEPATSDSWAAAKSRWVFLTLAFAACVIIASIFTIEASFEEAWLEEIASPNAVKAVWPCKKPTEE